MRWGGGDDGVELHSPRALWTSGWIARVGSREDPGAERARLSRVGESDIRSPIPQDAMVGPGTSCNKLLRMICERSERKNGAKTKFAMHSSHPARQNVR